MQDDTKSAIRSAIRDLDTVVEDAMRQDEDSLDEDVVSEWLDNSGNAEMIPDWIRDEIVRDYMDGGDCNAEMIPDWIRDEIVRDYVDGGDFSDDDVRAVIDGFGLVNVIDLCVEMEPDALPKPDAAVQPFIDALEALVGRIVERREQQ